MSVTYGGGYQLNQPYYERSSRYLRRGKTGPTAAAIDLTVTPSFTGISAPAAPTATAGSAGSLAAGVQTYAVTAYNINGETIASATASATTTGTTGSVSLALTAVSGALGYRIYKQVTVNAQNQLQLLADAGSSLTYVDTGALTPNAATLAPTVNTTQVIPGAIAGQVNAGDSVYRTANGGVAALYSASNSATYVGESEDSYPLASGIDQNLLIGRPTFDTHPVAIAIRTSGEFKKKTTPGETYTPGMLVYVGADPQTITNVASGTSIGRVCNDQSPATGAFSFSTTITGAVGQEIVIEITPPVSP